MLITYTVKTMLSFGSFHRLFTSYVRYTMWSGFLDNKNEQQQIHNIIEITKDMLPSTIPAISPPSPSSLSLSLLVSVLVDFPV